MPFIHVKSLPFDPPLAMSRVVEGLTRDFATGTGIGLEHITATWEFLRRGHYAVAGLTSLNQPQKSHPVRVDVLVPDGNSAEQIEHRLGVIAASITERAGVPISNIFIHGR